jgi:hypothetical protein
MERLDHAVVLKLPTDHEHVMVALWRLGLNRDPHMYTLGELNAVFSYDRHTFSNAYFSTELQE